MALLDTDFDPFKQCFIDDSDVEFYGSAASPNTTTPSEDIWKKFDDDMDFIDCFPTPPLSPSHPGSDGEDTGGGGGLDFNLPGSFLTEKLQCVSDFGCEFLEEEPAWLTQPITFPMTEVKQHTIITPASVLRGTSPARIGLATSTKSNFLIQDCMWSAIQAEERRRQMQAAKTARLGGQASGLATSAAGDLDQCVDPTSVFPYPLSETRLDISPATPSDSEEEIDVVTVDKSKHQTSSHNHHHHHHHHTQQQQQQQQRTLIIKRHHSSSSKHSRKHNTTQQVFKVIKRCSSNKSILTKIPSTKKLAKQLSSLGKHVNLEDVKRALETTMAKQAAAMKASAKNSNNHKDLKRPYNRSNSNKNSSRGSSRGSSRSGSRASSDSEDTDRRANHNVLERRRREDLRTSFFKLRDEVPELKTQERAAKIVILRKATEYVSELHQQQAAMRSQQDALRRQQRILLQKLADLKAGPLSPL